MAVPSDISRLFRLLLGGSILVLASQAYAQIAVAGDLIFVEENVRPGDSYGGTLILRNLGGTVASATIYLNDVLFEGTEQAYVEPGTQQRSNAGWVELDLSAVQLEGGESASVSFTITVPDDADLSNSYWSMAMVENTPAGGGPVEQGVQIRSVTRYGVYLVTDMAQRTPVQLDFSAPRLHKDGDGSSLFSVSIANSGERLVRPASYLDLYDSAGKHVSRVDNEAVLIFPGSRVEQDYELGELEPGTYTAIAVVDAGGDDIFGARYTLELEGR